jgi:hypothetical protein
MLTSRREAGRERSHTCRFWGLVRMTATMGVVPDLTGGRFSSPGAEGEIAFHGRMLLADFHKEVAL